ncbi:mitochondrial 37S ribosomal protein bS18m [Arthrobotrys flagrans]|uniref:Small ribosomal subunit protein bS18m n=1 Tax=Arthrobotrys flagrans TaxID=97331 RepID=A0A436ZUW5_ARTFL|nr:hypothetical protein DFL_006965 [Arthrobotrys flagrans]
MPPRPSTAVVKTFFGNGPILPFLYPAASRRLLSSTPPTRAGDENSNDKFIGIMDNLRSATPAALPSLPDEAPASRSQRPPTNFATMQQRKRAFQDMAALNVGTSKVVKKLQDLVHLRHALKDSMERVDPEIFRHSAPVLDRSFLSPKDLSYEEHQKFNQNRKLRVKDDVFNTLQENPMSFYKNFNLLKDFMTSAGRIKHRSITGLSNTNQRKVSKAIRRAIGIGLMPSVYRHPSLLLHEQRMSQEGFKHDRAGNSNRDERDRPRREPIDMRLGA